jgi:hypothetical protein
MDKHTNHGEWVKGFFAQQQMVFDSSSQAMYVYLDDDCRTCNQKFASLLGYDSPADWEQVNVEGMFPKAFVDPKSQQTLVSAYQRAMEEMAASTVKVFWKKKSGGSVETTVVLVPVAYEGHLFALHFVSE